MKTKGRLLILCGSEWRSRYDYYVTWSPLRSYELFQKMNCRFDSFGDFTPDEEYAERFDRDLIIKIEAALLREASANRELRWAPLAVQQIQWRLARYCWLKECVGRIIARYQPQEITLSSDKDHELVNAVREVCRTNEVDCFVENGVFDYCGSLAYLAAPCDLPIKLDPQWLWRLFLRLPRKVEIYCESHWNLKNFFNNGVYSFTFNRTINLGQGLFAHFLQRLRIRRKKEVIVFDKDIYVKTHYPITQAYWDFFEEDERGLVQNCVNSFFNYYPPGHLDLLRDRLAIFLKKVKVKRLIVANDKTPLARLLSFVSRQVGIEVDYLMHGLIFEHDTAPQCGSLFLPHRYLAWNPSSSYVYEKLGYRSLPVRHPRNQISPKPFQPLSGTWPDAKVLIMASYPDGGSIGVREDCFIHDVIEVLGVLYKLNCKPSNVFIKLHRANSKEMDRMFSNLKQLRESGNLSFCELDPSKDSISIMDKFNLIILYPTTGLFEAVFCGVPMVYFGNRPFEIRIGALKDIELPRARNAEELQSLLLNYDNEHTAMAYEKLVRSLKEGLPLSQALNISR